jgi:hypothetical protein
MVNECTGYKRDLKIENYTDLVKLLERCVFHSHLKSGKLVSTLHVNMPIWGKRNHVHRMERTVVCDIGQSAENEMTGAIEVLARELKYLIEHGTEYDEPVYGRDDETGEEQHIGRSVCLIDRSRLTLPILTTDSVIGHPYLDCAKDYAPS